MGAATKKTTSEKSSAAKKAAATRRKNAECKKEVRHQAAIKAAATRRKNAAANGKSSMANDVACVACHVFQLNAATSFITLCDGPSGAKKVLEEAIKRFPR